MPQDVDPEALRAMIAELSALTEEDFNRALGDNLVDEDKIETAAFRHPDLVDRTWVALQTLLSTTQQRLNRETDLQRRRRTAYFMQRATQEKRLLELVRDGLRAQRGIVSNKPNPRARAARELQRLHAEEYVQLVRKHERLIVEERRAARAEQKAQQRRKP